MEPDSDMKQFLGIHMNIITSAEAADGPKCVVRKMNGLSTGEHKDISINDEEIDYSVSKSDQICQSEPVFSEGESPIQLTLLPLLCFPLHDLEGDMERSSFRHGFWYPYTGLEGVLEHFEDTGSDVDLTENWQSKGKRNPQLSEANRHPRGSTVEE
ncbi:hypothetical protein Q7C36_018316 [Tachysurus vachellii]|uniref:Uncharacterized protein n=1 Tax=Tachysurus vachellii TaxID=175792 RepID=A0AA88LZV6_TACVA|nr:hypothetical protein Q7C36_018316 [Tachysurus vachellii]